MEFEDRAAFEAYHVDPALIGFGRERWRKAVEHNTEFDCTIVG
jgi:hypothetical protein